MGAAGDQLSEISIIRARDGGLNQGRSGRHGMKWLVFAFVFEDRNDRIY